MDFLDSASSHAIIAHGVPYTIYEGGEGMPLLLLHGFTGAASSWSALLPALSSQYRVIVPDLLGHGATGAPDDPARYTIEHQSADLIAILDALEIERVGLHGYSMGGRLALYTAIAYQSRFFALSLESASPGLAAESERQTRHQSDQRLAARILDGGIETFVNEWEQLPLFSTQSTLPRDVLEAQRKTRLNQRPMGLANSLRGMGTGAQPPLWHRLNELSMPVQLMTGALDHKFDAIADQMTQTIPHARRIRVPDASHTIYLEQPRLWLDFIQSFFS
jgi:2-succinyl-6-hydroxy-2,4-cyclohexadiene-1-carboxylate synthase